MSATWSVSVDVISQPIIADGVALVMAKTPAVVELIAVNAQDGSELWRQDIHPGIGALGIELTPQVTKTSSGTSAAVFLQASAAPTDDRGYSWWTEAVAVDVTTGEELYRGESQLVTTRPSACADAVDMCFSFRRDDGQSEEQRVNLDSGEVTSGRSVVPLDGRFRAVDEAGLYSQVLNGTESLTRVSEGKQLWEKDIIEIFGAGATTDLGWEFTYINDKDLFIGSVGVNPDPGKDVIELIEEDATFPQTDKRVVGFEASTGEVLWTAAGAESWCSSHLELSPQTLKEGLLPVRCEYTQGSTDFNGNYQDVKGKVVGYDPLTGEAKWETATVSVPASDALLIPSVSNGRLFLFGGADGLELVSTTTGESRLATEEDVFLCTERAKYSVPEGSPYLEQYGDLGKEGVAGEIAFACDEEGDPVDAITKGAIQDVGSVDGQVVIVATEGQLAGYPS